MNALKDVDPNEHIPNEFGTMPLIDYAFCKKAPDETIFDLIKKGARRESCSMVNQSQFDVCAGRMQELKDLVDYMNAWESDTDNSIIVEEIIPHITKDNVQYKNIRIEKNEEQTTGTLLELAIYKKMPGNVLRAILSSLNDQEENSKSSSSRQNVYPKDAADTLVSLMHENFSTHNISAVFSDSSGESYTSYASIRTQTSSLSSGSDSVSSNELNKALEALSDGSFSDDDQSNPATPDNTTQKIKTSFLKPEMHDDGTNKIPQ